MLSENKNEFEMNGKKFKLNVGYNEIESLLSKSERLSSPNKASQLNEDGSIQTDVQVPKKSGRSKSILKIDVG